MMGTPYDDCAADHALERWAAADAELRRALRNRIARGITAETWDRVARDGLTRVDASAAEERYATTLGIPEIPSDWVVRTRRLAQYFGNIGFTHRKAYYAALDALDRQRVRAALALALEAQARACIAGRADGWLSGHAVQLTAWALAGYRRNTNWRAAMGRLAEAVRAYIVALATSATTTSAA